MSFSIPITSNPPSMRCETDSDPINPPDPVTIARGTLFSLKCGLHDSLVLADPLEDVGEDLTRSPRAPPLSVRAEQRAVGNINGDVPGPLLVGRPDGNLAAGDIPAQLRGFGERKAAIQPSAHVHHHTGPVVGTDQLVVGQLNQVLHVQQVADLLASPSETDVAELAPEVVGEHPVGECALINVAHLPVPRDHAA